LFKPLLAIFQYIVAVSFNGAGEKTTDLPQVKDKLYHIKSGLNNENPILPYPIYRKHMGS
jgi:hypothetical protein